MQKTTCLICEHDMLVDSKDLPGDGYFFGYDTDYYGDYSTDFKDPHEVIGHICKSCGDKLRIVAEKTEKYPALSFKK